MSLASKLSSWFEGAPDPRSDREIADEIEAELAFHLQQREREFIAQGMSPEEAREAALRQFGNVDKVRAECRRVQMGGRIMLQRVTLMLLVVLLAAVVVLGWKGVVAQQRAGEEMAELREDVSAIAKVLVVDSGDAPPPEDEHSRIESKISRYLRNQKVVRANRTIQEQLVLPLHPERSKLNSFQKVLFTQF